MVVPAKSSSFSTMPGLTIRQSIADRPSIATATRSASFAAAKLTTSLNEPPDANSASPDDTIG